VGDLTLSIFSIQQFFKYGLDREIPELWVPPRIGHRLNLGPGDKKEIPGTVGVGRGGKLMDVYWNAPDRLPYSDGTVAEIHAYQFMEHFTGDEVLMMLRDFERVLMIGGCVYIATPHQYSTMAHQALDHRSVWNEEVWNWLFGNEYYSDHEEQPWKFNVHCCFLMGVVYRNLNVFTQLVRTAA